MPDGKIIIEQIEDKQIEKMRKELKIYNDIMTNRNHIDEEFCTKYYKFYLCSGFARMSSKQSKEIYFNLLQTSLENGNIGRSNLKPILVYLKENLECHTCEYSFSTKLLHTVNPECPIFDSHVKGYLTDECHVHFVDIYGRRDTRENLIEQNYEKLCKWYDNFLPSDEGKKWVEWFNKTFPSYDHISDVKKIDFIIYVCSVR